MSKKIVVQIDVTPEEVLRMAERGYLPERLSHRHAEQGIQALTTSGAGSTRRNDSRRRCRRRR